MITLCQTQKSKSVFEDNLEDSIYIRSFGVNSLVITNNSVHPPKPPSNVKITTP